MQCVPQPRLPLPLPTLSSVSAAAAAAVFPSPTTARSPMQPFQSNALFGSFDDPLLQARAAQAALENIDVKNVIPMRPDAMFNYSNYLMSSQAGQDPHNLYQGIPSSSAGGSDTGVFDPSLLVPTSSDQSIGGGQDSMTSLQQVMAMHAPHYPSHPFQYPMPVPSFASVSSVTGGAEFKSGWLTTFDEQTKLCNSSSSAVRYPLSAVPSEIDTDPRELERFAEHFKQRRIKLGVTQADVGKALAHLRMPGVGSLSQSTICRFESLTLSHNNMVALKPILHSWLEKAEEAVKNKDIHGDLSGILPNTDKKRKRTSIAAPEKRLLEDYFRQQPRPSGERIAAIADKLDLKKNVVRVWFCNQRQKQKRSALSQFRSSCRTVMPSVVAGLSSSISNPTVSSSTSSSSAAARSNQTSMQQQVAASVAAAAGLPAFAAIGNGTYFD